MVGRKSECVHYLFEAHEIILNFEAKMKLRDGPTSRLSTTPRHDRTRLTLVYAVPLRGVVHSGVSAVAMFCRASIGCFYCRDAMCLERVHGSQWVIFVLFRGIGLFS